ncbi:MAG: hypothetical protein HRT94_06155 [Alphaproteobacteria bacterium]|nr:hypothetical protein [Alphaproteobacteria bacterium]
MNQMTYRKTEQGNVLFLILIAVALFAALSYAVTQSTRSGGGSADREQAILSSAALTQFPASLRTSLVRMVLNGTSVNGLEFNPPSDFGDLSSEAQGVFHPNGGGAVYQEAPNDVMDSAGGNTGGQWYYNGHFELVNIGIAGSSGNDIIAFLPGITETVCERINQEVGIGAGGCTATADANVPDINSAVTEDNIDTEFMDDTYTLPTTDQEDISNATCNVFAGQPMGCFYDTDNSRYVFYSVLLER